MSKGNRSKGDLITNEQSSVSYRPHIIYDSSIEQLRITEERIQERLKQFEADHLSQNLSQGLDSIKSLKNILVRKTIPEKDRPKLMRKVAVLRKACEESALAEQITTIPLDSKKLTCRRQSNFNWHAAGLGPRFSPDGTILNHSILGDPVIFYQIALARNDISWNMVPKEIQLQLQATMAEMQNLNVPIALSCIPEQTSPGSHVSNESNLTVNYSTISNHPSVDKENKNSLDSGVNYSQGNGDMASLENWRLKVEQQRLIQQKLSGLMKRKSNDLVMNSGENIYEVQLAKEKIDRVMPLVSDGKGRRFMSEFWNQPEYIRNEKSDDICTTLTMKERGIYKPIEFIKCPKVIKEEKGLISSECTNTDASESSTKPHRGNLSTPRRRNTYLTERNQELSQLINMVAPYEPLMDDLAIIGEKVLNTEVKNESVEIQNSTMNDLKENTMNEMNEKPLECETVNNVPIESKINEPFINEPSLYLNGYHLDWQKNTLSQSQIGVDIHLTFVNENSILQTDYIELFNNGNVVITYEWTRVRQQSHFNLDNKGHKAFYFDPKPGKVQPGEIIHLPITLKSPHEGIHKEIWRFDTTPVLCGTHAIRVHFHAISVWPEYHQFCSILAKDIFIQLENEANYRMVYRMLENIIMNIQPEERPPSPVYPPRTAEEVFALSNSSLNYKHNVIQKLKQLYTELKEREYKILGNSNETSSSNTDSWNYSISELRKMIYKYPPDMSKMNAAAKREEEFNKFFQTVDQLAFPVKLSFINPSMERYRIGYTFLSQTLVSLFELCSNLRQTHGLEELTSGPVKSQRGLRNANQTYERPPVSAVTRNPAQMKPYDEFPMETGDKSLQPDQLLLPEDSQDSDEFKEFIKTISPNSKLWKAKATSIVYVRLSEMLDDLFVCWNET
uniref:MYCBP-associated protein n=1 Tax=Trichobilharzia regenti TaxID=157069 RepID=A0AA85JQ58_TRIRE|nr:unnamed protein product [Trichobilharzia regenti]